MKLRSLLSLTCAVMLGAGCSDDGSSGSKKADDPLTTAFDGSHTLKFEEGQGKAEGGKVIYSFFLPRFKGPDGFVEKKVNSDLEATVEQLHAVPTEELPAGADPANPVTFTSTAQERRLDEVTLFVQLATVRDDKTGTEPGPSTLIVGYDLSNGKRIILADLFKSPNVADKKLVAAAFPRIQNLFPEQDLSESTQATIDEVLQEPVAKTFANFVPQSDGLHVVFEDQRLRDAGMDEAEITVPWSAVQKELSPLGLRLARKNP